MQSTLERHHLASTFNAIRKPQFNFVEQLSPDNLTMFRQVVIECVLATDLAKSMSWLASATASLISSSEEDNGSAESLHNSSTYSLTRRGSTNTTTSSNRKRIESKLIRMQLAIKCADVGHPARELDTHLAWTKRVTEEFYAQGDLERAQGMKLSPLCDRNQSKLLLAQGQIGFITFVAKPLFALLEALCDESEECPWKFHLERNIRHWEESRSRNSLVGGIDINGINNSTATPTPPPTSSNTSHSIHKSNV